MQNVKFIRTGLFPLRKLKINVNNQTYFLKGNGEIVISLPERSFEFELTMDWWHSNQTINLSENEKSIVISHCISDKYFFSALILLLILSILTFLQIMPINLLAIFLIIFVFSQVYYLIFKPKKYFTVSKI